MNLFCEEVRRSAFHSFVLAKIICETCELRLKLHNEFPFQMFDVCYTVICGGEKVDCDVRGKIISKKFALKRTKKNTGQRPCFVNILYKKRMNQTTLAASPTIFIIVMFPKSTSEAHDTSIMKNNKSTVSIRFICGIIEDISGVGKRTSLFPLMLFFLASIPIWTLFLFLLFYNRYVQD